MLEYMLIKTKKRKENKMENYLFFIYACVFIIIIILAAFITKYMVLKQTVDDANKKVEDVLYKTSAMLCLLEEHLAYGEPLTDTMENELNGISDAIHNFMCDEDNIQFLKKSNRLLMESIKKQIGFIYDTNSKILRKRS